LCQPPISPLAVAGEFHAAGRRLAGRADHDARVPSPSCTAIMSGRLPFAHSHSAPGTRFVHGSVHEMQRDTLRRGDVEGRGRLRTVVCRGQRDDRRLSEMTQTDVVRRGLQRQPSARAHTAKTNRHQQATCAPLFSSIGAAHRVDPSLVRRGLFRLGGVGG